MTMKKLCGLGFIFSLATMTYAKEDITESYLTNPSFENDAELCTESSANKVSESSDGLRGWNIVPDGWKVTPPSGGKSYLITKDCFTDNGFGKTSLTRRLPPTMRLLPPPSASAMIQRRNWETPLSRVRPAAQTS